VPDNTQPPVMIVCADTDTGYRLAQLLRREKRPVIALMRRRADPSLIRKMGCEVVPADPTDREEVQQIFRTHAGPEVEVVCMLGGTPQLNSQGNINVIEACEASGVRRLIMLTSIGCGDSIAAVDPFVKAFIGKSLRAKNWAETRLRSSALDWTIVRPGGMVRRATRGEPILVDNPNVGGYINVFDLGDAIHQVLHSPSTVRRTYTAVDSARAFDVKGEPLVPAEL
jgi:nucleoside-diphosphate-sugar epimerase